MAIVFNGAVLDWYQEAVYMNGTAISTPSAPGDVYFNGTRVFGLSGTYGTTLYSFGLAPDSSTFENTHIPALTSTYNDAFLDYAYETGPGGDTRWYYELVPGYQFVTSDGTFSGGEDNLYWDGKYWTGYLWEGQTVTGASTSHNGGTSVVLKRDDGV